MDENQFRIRTPFVSFGFSKKDNEIRIKEGETIIMKEWSWRKFKHVKKSFRQEYGVVVVDELE